MIALRRRHAYLAGALLVVLANAVALLGVADNRSGEPESRLTLSERELIPRFGDHLEGEGNGVTLDPIWRVLLREEAIDTYGGSFYGGGGSPAWFDRAKLEQLGFDLSRPLEEEADRRHYRRTRPRQALLVLELNGATYRQAMERATRRLADERSLLRGNDTAEFRERVKKAEQALQRERDEASRLFVIDAGLDRAALRAAHPDRRRYAIVRGEVRISVIGKEGNEQVAGSISDLAMETINVPHALQGPFSDLRRIDPYRRKLKARVPFTVTVAFGRRLEPWVTAVTVSTPPPATAPSSAVDAD
ncbi:DUF4824 family protein [Endothiovibrio diazotrophicus]